MRAAKTLLLQNPHFLTGAAGWPIYHNHFTALFPGPPGWAGARRKLLLDFMVLGRITRGRHTDNPGVRHSIWTNQQSTSMYPPCRPSRFDFCW